MKIIALALIVFGTFQQANAGFVISDNDANIDDVFAYLLLAFSKNPLSGIVVTNADCMGYQTINGTIPKVQTFANATYIPFGMTKARAQNPFPWFYRSFSASMGEVKCLSTVVANTCPEPDGDALYERLLVEHLKNGQRVTIVATGPLTALANLLAAHPELEDAIDGLIWEAGAVGEASGNIDPKAVYDFVVGTQAEWNVFWDPKAVDFIFRNTKFPITLLPVNLTNDAELTKAVMNALQAQSEAGYPLSTFAYEAYSIVSNLTKTRKEDAPGDATSYYLWDVVAAIYYLQPSYFVKPDSMKLSVQLYGKDQGSLYLDDFGRDVQVVLSFNGKTGLDAFYDYFLHALRR